MAADRSEPGIDPVRRAWLRELGIERLWNLPAGAAASPPLVQTEYGDRGEAEGDRVQPQSGTDAPALADARATPETTEPEAILEPGMALADPASSPAPVDPEQAWTTLEDEVRNCVACGLCKGRTQTVFGTGSRKARWMLVGEAPGEQEDRQGAPFVGRSGKLLDSMLAAIGRSRQADVFIANVIKCRPPGNRDPLPEEVARCSPYLMRQIALLNPDMILVLGRFAAQTLLETDARIGSLRGRVHALSVEGKSVPVVVSYHPAYLLRSPAEKIRAWQDLRLALSVGGA